MANPPSTDPPSTDPPPASPAERENTPGEITEKTRYSDCTHRKLRYSRLVSTLVVDGEDVFVCPRCHTEQPDLRHGATKTTCRGKCGLSFNRRGNALYLHGVPSKGA